MNKKLLKILTACILALAVLASCSNSNESGDVSDTSDGIKSAENSSDSENTSAEIVVAERDTKSPFMLVYNVDVAQSERDDILRIRKELESSLGSEIKPLDDFDQRDECQYELIVNSARRKESAGLLSSLEEYEYAIKTEVSDEKTSIIIVYNGNYARMCAIDRFIDECIYKGEGKISASLNIREKCRPNIIESDIECLRDPCVIYDNGTYYAYGTGWTCYYNDTGSLESGWKGPKNVVEMPSGHESEGGCHWAPEVHKYKDSFYMFTTYLSNKTNHRGCTILKADSPLGPFTEITDGYITPENWDAIDGTFYVDGDGQPWMVFVHEWTSTDDGVGRMAAAKLSEDLTSFISEPIELFRADDPSWSRGSVTDGCWMYTTEAGSLLMIWSNWDSAGYCVGIARSESGKIEGPWTQEDKLLYSKNLSGKYDGGHGMIFTHTDCEKYLAIHSPNNSDAGRLEKPVFIPLIEKNDTLVWNKN